MTQLLTRNKRQRNRSQSLRKELKNPGVTRLQKTEDKGDSVQALKCDQEEEGIGLAACGPGGHSQETCEKRGRSIFISAVEDLPVMKASTSLL